jgi:CBS domain-containing protein
MKIRDLMSKPVPVFVGTSIDAALAILHEHHADHLVVIDGARVVGLIGEHTLAQHEHDADAWALTVGPITSPLGAVVAPDQSVFDAASAFFDRRVEALAVVEQGQLVGVIGRRDLLRAPQPRRQAPLRRAA